MINPLLTIIIPNYNGRQILEENLPKILESVSNDKVEIVVVDDASTDDSVEFLSTAYASIVVKKHDVNKGFASTVNDGVIGASAEIVFLLNSDAVPPVGFVHRILEHFNDKNTFAVGCLLQSEEDGKVVQRGRGVGAFRKGLFVHGPGSIDKKNTLWVTAGAAAYSKSLWAKLNGMDTLYNPFYWEDIDISYRALKSGFDVKFDPTIGVKHTQSKGAIRTHYDSSIIRRTAYRNQFIFHWKNITDAKALFLHFFWMPYHLLAALLRGDLAFFYGFLQAIVRLPTIVRHRSRDSSFFTQTDSQVVQPFVEEFNSQV